MNNLESIMSWEFLNTKVSQGSVTRLGCAGILNEEFVIPQCWVRQWKIFENWSTFSEVMCSARIWI